MPKKKQYVVPARLHYDVFSRDSFDYGVSFTMEYVCSTNREDQANLIARSLADRQKYASYRSFVVRVRPTEAHNTAKFYCEEFARDEEQFEDWKRESLADAIGQRVIEASVNGNGKPSPTVVKAVQKVLH